MGQNQTCFGEVSGDNSASESLTIDLNNSLPKAPMRRSLVSEQLYTGHMRLDLARPLTKGNVILLKGEKSTGKTHVAINAIKHFVQEDPEHNHAIYVGLSKKSCNEVLGKCGGVGSEINKNVLTIGTSDDMHAASGEYFFGPRAGLHALQALKDKVGKGCKVLFVFD